MRRAHRNNDTRLSNGYNAEPMRNVHAFQPVFRDRIPRDPLEGFERQRRVGRVGELGYGPGVECVAGCAEEEDVCAGLGGGNAGEGLIGVERGVGE